MGMGTKDNNNTFKVEILKDDPRLKLKKGEVYIAEVFWQDPTAKAALIERVSDGFDPMCTVYWQDIKCLDGEAKKQQLIRESCRNHNKNVTSFLGGVGHQYF